MFFEIFTERQGLSHQIGTKLAERLVEPFDRARFAGLFADLMPPFRRQDRGVALPDIAGQQGTCAIIRRQRLPHRPTRHLGTVAKGDPDDPPGLACQRQPHPDLLRVCADIRPQFIQFQNRAFAQWRDGVGKRPNQFFLTMALTVWRLTWVMRATARRAMPRGDTYGFARRLFFVRQTQNLALHVGGNTKVDGLKLRDDRADRSKDALLFGFHEHTKQAGKWQV